MDDSVCQVYWRLHNLWISEDRRECHWSLSSQSFTSKVSVRREDSWSVLLDSQWASQLWNVFTIFSVFWLFPDKLQHTRIVVTVTLPPFYFLFRERSLVEVNVLHESPGYDRQHTLTKLHDKKQLDFQSIIKWSTVKCTCTQVFQANFKSTK